VTKTQDFGHFSSFVVCRKEQNFSEKFVLLMVRHESNIVIKDLARKKNIKMVTVKSKVKGLS